jgi:DNA polymerase-3 subunit alpha
VDYFLIVGDFISFAKQQGIPSPGRGSAAGCMVSYCMDITTSTHEIQSLLRALPQSEKYFSRTRH